MRRAGLFVWCRSECRFPPAGHGPVKTKPASLTEIWSLEAGGSDEPGVLWAGTIPGGLFRSEDSGRSWQLNEPLWNRPERWRWFGGGKDEPGIHSVWVDPRDSQRLTIGISCGGVWRSSDGGLSWNATPPDCGPNMCPRSWPAIR